LGQTPSGHLQQPSNYPNEIIHINFFNHVSYEIQQEIKNNRYVDITKLVRKPAQALRKQQNVFMTDKAGFLVSTKPAYQQIADFNVWLYCFRAMIGISQLGPAPPPLLDMLQYEYIIQKYSKVYEWFAVLNFDMRARQDIATTQVYSWANPRTDLVNEELYAHPLGSRTPFESGGKRGGAAEEAVVGVEPAGAVSTATTIPTR
jgi:hypothetical protein